MRFVAMLLVAACSKPSPPEPTKPAATAPPLPRCDNGNAGELHVYHTRDELPADAAVPADFDFARFELAGPPVLPQGALRIVTAQARPCDVGRKIVEPKTCGPGRQEPPEPPRVILWQLPQGDGSVWYEVALQVTGCAP
jgi:hypothetical protein